MRLFIEAQLDADSLRVASLAAERLRLQPFCPNRALRWVKPSAMHLTLRFLGEVPPDDAEQISSAIQALQCRGTVALQLGQVGAFGGNRPRVLWIGVDEVGTQRLQHLRAQLDDALLTVGLNPEPSSYRPHLTLARVRRQASNADLKGVRELIRQASPLQRSATVDRVALVKSTLSPTGPHYQRLSRVEL